MVGKNRCLYNETFQKFCSEDEKTILGFLVNSYHGDLPTTSIDAWVGEIEIMKQVLNKFKEDKGQIVFEYDIPRLGKRIDVVLLYRGIIFCIEFKVFEKEKETAAAIDQVFDYALDLNNFHKFSYNKVIAPILVVVKNKNSNIIVQKSAYSDNVLNPFVTGANGLLSVIDAILASYPAEKEIDENWIISPYAPTPTIIEAAKALYENHSVEDITRHEAEDADTDKTISYLSKVIAESKQQRKKSICFVTGVPGAGKTLVGLDVAFKQPYREGEDSAKEEAVYLSGNQPLVAVLAEALAQNNVKKCKEKGVSKKITDARREVKKSIQLIHRYRDNMLKKIKNPIENGIIEIDPEKAVKNDEAGFGEIEHIAIFDEAQRSWTKEKLALYLKKGGTYGNKLKVPNFPWSEAAFLIWSLDQREDWAVIICLVGGGQEINTGEAGISEWIKSLNEQFPHWRIYISNKLTDKEYAEGKVYELLKNNNKVTYAEELHLSVSLRSFRAEKLSAFVHYLLDLDIAKASSLYAEIKEKYPIFLTRDMEKARKWLRSNTRGNERSGVLVTKASARYKPLAVHVIENNDSKTVHWFLDDKNFTTSSNFLEDAVTEIQVQGLELDYTCLLWDADMRYDNGKWRFYEFAKQKWSEQIGNKESTIEKIKYMLNAYRVLLTRARKGMIICVPEGNGNISYNGLPEDKTRLPKYYDDTYKYLKEIGIDEI